MVRYRLRLVAWAVTLAVAGAGCEDDRVKLRTPRMVVHPGDSAAAGDIECLEVECKMDFGLVHLGDSRVLSLRVANLGDGELGIPEMTLDPGPFSLLTPNPARLAPDQELEIELAYTPVRQGEDTGRFVLRTDDPDRPRLDVWLAGRCEIVPAPQLQVCVRARPSEPDHPELSCLPPHAVDFGPVALAPLGAPRSTPLVMRNLGKEMLILHGVQTGAGTSGEFTLEPGDFTGQVPAVGADGTPGEASVLVWYSPVDGGSDRGTVEITSNDPDDRLVEVRLAGSGIAPRICSQPLQLDFGRVARDHTARRSFSVTNCGLLTLTVGTIQFGEQSSQEFAFEALPLTPFDIEPEESVDITVAYTPVDTGPDGGRVYLQSNDPSAETGFILLQAEGTDEPVCDLEVLPSRLNFGMVAIGESADKTTVMSNTGTAECHVDDIVEPAGPAADAFVFSSRPITPFVLSPGDQKQLTVRYTAVDAGPHQARVDILSDDYESDTIQVELYGNDPDVPECDVEVVPVDVQFGVVAMWRTAAQELLIRNRGAEPCSLDALTFDPHTDGAFTIAEAPSLPALIPPHGSASVVLGFTPIRRGMHSGWITVLTSDPDTPATQVTLGGAGEELNLMVIPETLDFGLVTVGCNSPERSVTVYNIGSSSVSINDVYLDPVLTDPDFTIEALEHHGPAAVPFVLSSADSFSVTMRYAPAAVTENAGVLVVESSAAIGAYIEVDLAGAGTNFTSQTDIFSQLDQPMVDVLWVIDNSGSMVPQQQALAQNFATFINWAITLQTDFQIGVITTEINEPETPADFFNIYPGVLVNYPGFPKILDNTTPNLAQAFGKNVNVGTCCSDEQESGLHAAMMALSEPLVSSPAANDGFLREDAKLVIIMVSDEVDQSPAPVDFYVDFFKSIKGQRNDQLMDVSVIVGDVPGGCHANGISAEASPRYLYVQEATDGIFRSHCAANWGATLSDLGLDAFAARTQFPLSRPALPGSIVVSVDEHDGNGPRDVPEDTDGSGDGWEYDLPSNSIVFGDDVVPGRGATITVDYEATCL